MMIHKEILEEGDGPAWTGETKREHLAVLKKGLAVKLFNSRSATIG